MASGRKRKRESADDDTMGRGDRDDLSLQAFEAVINPIDRQQEVKLASGASGSGSSAGLIEWAVSGLNEPVLMDRYDARLLLDTLPANLQSQRFDKLQDPGDGWEDLPLDSEDLFFFSLAEAEDIRREKRRRLIESNQEARLLAMKASDPVKPEDTWEGSDEEPEASEMALMSKTAAYIVSSPNPVQLEMRILANHGGDPRFAFLRGRWKRAWASAKESSKSRTAQASLPKSSGLVSYDSGDEKSRNDDDMSEGVRDTHSQAAADDARIKAERRARVKEWSRKRKEHNGL